MYVCIVRRQKKHETTLKVNYITSGFHKTYAHEFRPLFFEEISQIFYEETENGKCISLKFTNSLYSITYIHTYKHMYIPTYQQINNIQLTYRVVVKDVSGYCVYVNTSFWQIQSHKYT